ncbi:MAG: EAL domain-containing protein [Chloroflexota bacterium]
MSAIAKALAYGDFVFFYQPIVSFVTGKVCGAEALIRWQRTDGSLVPASMFIPLAEETGFITEMTQAMLPKLMADVTAIHQLDYSMAVGLNVSAKDLGTNGFASSILQALREYHIDPSKLRVEITETQAITLNEHMRNPMFTLDAEGVRIAIDDFGSGYSSIALIRDLPITILKIDQSFVSQIFKSERSAQIVRHSISLAHQLEMETIGEGVETQEVFDFLLCFGCDCAQGFYFSAPLPLADFLAFLSQGKRYGGLPPLGLIHLAQQDHLDWRRDFLREILNIVSAKDEESKHLAETRIPKVGLRECLFGKWYYDAGQEFRGNALFDQIGIVHRQLHQIAECLVQAVRAGASKEQVAESIWSFNEHSYKLVQLLCELHTRIALKYKGLTPDW